MVEIRKVIIDGDELEVSIEQEGNVYHATIEGETFEITLPEATSSAPRKRASSGGRKKGGMVSASMPGKVVTVEVQVGEVVSEGQTVLILEAMKMQNEITAPIAGVVSEIHCTEGQSIEANVPLVMIEPQGEEEDSD